jgi:hypothetical protein
MEPAYTGDLGDFYSFTVSYQYEKKKESSVIEFINR